MKIAIIGVGGVGGYFGGLLARANCDVTFVARGEKFKALQQNGIKIITPTETFTVDSLHVVNSIADLPKVDIIFVTTKTYDLEDIGKQLALKLGSDTYTIIIPIQNGIDHDLRLQKFLPNNPVYPGIARVNAHKAEPGVIVQETPIKKLIFGSRTGEEIPQLKQLESVLKEANIDAIASNEFLTEMWVKFIYLTTYAGLTAASRTSIGDIASDSLGYEVYMRCIDEGIMVAKAIGVPLPDTFRSQMVKLLESYRDNNTKVKASMVIDIEKGSKTEIESLNGALVSTAREVSVSIPTHEAIYYMTKLRITENLRK